MENEQRISRHVFANWSGEAMLNALAQIYMILHSPSHPYYSNKATSITPLHTGLDVELSFVGYSTRSLEPHLFVVWPVASAYRTQFSETLALTNNIFEEEISFCPFWN